LSKQIDEHVAVDQHPLSHQNAHRMTGAQPHASPADHIPGPRRSRSHPLKTGRESIQTHGNGHADLIPAKPRPLPPLYFSGAPTVRHNPAPSVRAGLLCVHCA
jgi:hypothetical protein